jgi:undecaprenyl-diphosphatase
MRRLARSSPAAAVLGAVAVLALLGAAPRRERFDQRLSRIVQRLPERPSVPVSAAVAEAPHQALATGVVAAAALALILRSRRAEAGRLVLAAAGAAVVSAGVKRLLRRPRPDAELRLRPVEESGRFPSGHTTSAAIAGLAVSRALAGTGGPRVAGTAVAAAAALVVGVSRVRLGEHYVTDVLASYGVVLAAGLAVPRRPAGAG